MEKERLFGKTPDQLLEWSKYNGLPSFTARQITDWLYKKEVKSIEEFSNLSKSARNKLQEQFDFGLDEPVNVSESKDGTKKYLFPVENEKTVESAYIPEKDRATLCLSTQVGCKMGCLFCMTARQGFQGNLDPGQILNQFRSLPEKSTLTNLVYMGMGEPLDNLENVLTSLDILTSEWGFAMSPRRITVSTIGLIPALSEFLHKSEVHLAISLNSPFEKERQHLMPVQNIYTINKVLEVVKGFDPGRQRRISFEYIMFRELNDTPRHINEIAKILNGIRCRVNLIRFHPIPGSPLMPSDEKTIEAFLVSLNKKGIRTTIRASRGQDIEAACGMLSTRKNSGN
ncbi:MAG: 23S rRNA (adenine(2503)-C(2))-methyltransferase RlmN [Desulfobacula sp.]|nr:23S rRNA (adenine(2503)-C(2))-methyltransferase RlmN [Desulfobacula sp.]